MNGVALGKIGIDGLGISRRHNIKRVDCNSVDARTDHLLAATPHTEQTRYKSYKW
jgi:hypothetical protein